jgi:UDP-3-O-[3-hydroxymyristoyl] glucosamine N-acyltransferase
MRLDELAQAIDAELVGDPAIEVNSVAELEVAKPGQISFLSNQRYGKLLETTSASAVIAHPRTTNPRLAILKTKDPYFAFRQTVVLLHGYRKHPFSGIHPKANIDPTATIGENTIIYPGTFVGPKAKVGRDCIIYPNVVIYDNCVLGDRVIVHAGSVIGQDGFGFASSKGEHFKIPQTGNVIIEDDVEIGANCAIARAALGSTVIGKGTKIDALVIIGHGATIGPHGLLVAQVGVAGSTAIGHHATVGGQVGIAGHLKIGDNVSVAAQSGIVNDVDDQTIVMGSPAMQASYARRVYTLFTQLPQIVERIKAIELQVEELADSGDTPIV